jgi:SepF-like predicted cell division protein (DUF552 family)
MGKGLLRKLRPEHEHKETTSTYIDLSTVAPPGELDEGKGLKVAELHKYEDLSELITLVYNGHIVIIDYTPIANDDLLLRRITTELKSVTTDFQGDVAGLKGNLLAVTPSGFKIDRKIIRGH